MKYCSVRSLLALVCLSASLSLTGCSGFAGANFPDSAANPAASSVGPVTGSVYGGHAPLVNAHIYLVQPGTSGYGSVVKSLLTTSTNSTYPLTQNGSWPAATSGGNAADQFVPSTDATGKPFYGLTADIHGEFNLTGDYSCTVGQPVILIGYGGTPSFVPASSASTQNTFSISNETTYNDGSAGVYLTYTISGTLPELFYIGESVSVTGATGGFVGFNQSGTVLASAPISTGTATLSTTQFSIYVPYNATLTSAAPTGGYSGNIGLSVTGTPAFNPAAVNMAVLGNCPASGNFSTGASALQYVYMNEISTIAAAYSLAGFTNTAANGQSGYDEFHIGSPGTPQALQAIANSATTAGLLYDIQGSNTSTTFAGEGHIARAVTPNGGVGAVPQGTLDSLGNVLAACVDSNNTYRLGAGVTSPQCKALEYWAQDNGVYDTTATTHIAFNIAQAAFSISRFPQGNGTGTTACSCYGGAQTVTAGTSTSGANFAQGLYNIPAGNVPFAPQLSTAPNDWAVAIQWTTGSAVSDVEIDAAGNVFAPAGAAGMYEITPSGGLSTYTAAAGLSTALSASGSIDGVNGNIWAPGATGVYKFTAGTPAGTLVGGTNSTLSGTVVIDSALNQYVASGNDGLGVSALVKQNSAGTSAAGNFPVAGNPAGAANSAGICVNTIGYTLLDSASSIWTATSNNTFNVNPYVCRFDNNGNLQYSLAVPTGVSGQAGGFGFPRGFAVDAGNNAWFADKNLDALYKVTAGTTTNNSGYVGSTQHGILSAPKGVAVDGANTIWVSSAGDLNATTGAKYGTGLVQFSASDAPMTPKYITGAAATTTPTTSLGNLAIDASGNIWAAQTSAQGSTTTSTMVYEYIGVATPTVTPIAAAKSAGTVGGKPGLTVAHITAYNVGSVGSNIAQFYAADNQLTVGETITLSGFPTATFFNGQTIVITASSGALFSGSFTHANVSPTLENAVASAVN